MERPSVAFPAPLASEAGSAQSSPDICPLRPCHPASTPALPPALPLPRCRHARTRVAADPMACLPLNQFFFPLLKPTPAELTLHPLVPAQASPASPSQAMRWSALPLPTLPSQCTLPSPSMPASCARTRLALIPSHAPCPLHPRILLPPPRPHLACRALPAAPLRSTPLDPTSTFQQPSQHPSPHTAFPPTKTVFHPRQFPQAAPRHNTYFTSSTPNSSNFPKISLKQEAKHFPPPPAPYFISSNRFSRGLSKGKAAMRRQTACRHAGPRLRPLFQHPTPPIVPPETPPPPPPPPPNVRYSMQSRDHQSGLGTAQRCACQAASEGCCNPSALPVPPLPESPLQMITCCLAGRGGAPGGAARRDGVCTQQGGTGEREERAGRQGVAGRDIGNKRGGYQAHAMARRVGHPAQRGATHGAAACCASAQHHMPGGRRRDR